MFTDRFSKIKMAALLSASLVPGIALASSHREAPMVSEDPAVDSNDLYAFVSPEKPDTVTLIATYIPLEEPNGGPNFNKFGDDVLYELKIDNTGDAVADVTLQFRFATTVKNPNTFNYNLGPIDSPTAAALTFTQNYTLTYVSGGTSTVVGSGPVTPANLGPRSSANYGADVFLKGMQSHDLQGKDVKVFTGPVDDPFFVDLGAVFDLIGIRGATVPDPNIPGSVSGFVNGGVGGGNVGQMGGGLDGLAGFNTHAIAVQIPFSLVSKGGVASAAGLSPANPDSVIGVWTSASRPRVTVRRVGKHPIANHGGWVQVSRLGLPLINELLIPLSKKDWWNTTKPVNDVANFGMYFLDPEPARDVAIVYKDFFGVGKPYAVPEAPRADILGVASFLLFCGTDATCIQKWQAQIVPTDLLRLNLAVPAKAGTVANRMAVLGGDVGGFPNGRRLTDDVVDIIEQVVISGKLVSGRNPNMILPLGDGVDQNDRGFLDNFPYLSPPHEGYIHDHDRYEPIH